MKILVGKVIGFQPIKHVSVWNEIYNSIQPKRYKSVQSKSFLPINKGTDLATLYSFMYAYT